ncbi:hypothetical protein [Agreia sp. COWG]|uniref:hypothetical protein n=1 Tax=Agreia sp. COWG TaxID=2773266 RepID=UPI001926E34E|nr:hypothetical protein [Agreia sp. COWG]CAD6001154.1 conserved protein of unknown function [Agreia sp. COWG]
MGFLDKILGREPESQQQQAARGTTPDYGTPPGAVQDAPADHRSADEIAIERYRYLLRTAPPETIEQVHEEAFARLTPDQRAQVFEQLSANAPAGESPRDAGAPALAQAATRSELRNPGTLERSLALPGAGGAGLGMGMGSMFATSLLGSVAGVVIGSALAQAFMPDFSSEVATAGDGDSSGVGSEGMDPSSTDASSVDAAGDGGGDFGDFGGGDFGGGFDF